MNNKELENLHKHLKQLSLRPEVGLQAQILYTQYIHNNLKRCFTSKFICAACVYIAALQCGDRRTQREICEVYEMSAVSLLKYYKDVALITEAEVIL